MSLSISHTLTLVDNCADQKKSGQGNGLTESPGIDVKPEINHSTASSPQQAIWTAVYFPCISLEVFSVKEGIPMAVFEEIRGRQIVHTVCGIGQSQGIMPGMPLNAAFVLCRGLEVKPRNIALEARELKRRCRKIEHITPAVSLSGADTIVMEISRSLRLFGGFRAINEEVRTVFSTQLRCDYIVSSSPSPLASTLLAHNGMQQVIDSRPVLKSVLGELSLCATGLPDNTVNQLGRCGLKTLRDVWRLPRPDLARRFGTELLSWLDRVCAREPDPRKRIIPATGFFHSMELPMQTSSTKLILIAAERLLEKAEAFLRKRSSAAQKIIFGLCHSERHQQQWHMQQETGRKISRIEVSSRLAERDSRRFLLLFREKLERVDMDSPVISVSLKIDHVVVYQRPTENIFDYQSASSRSGDVQRQWSELMDLLTARLGDGMVYVIAAVDDHRPERAWQSRPPVFEKWKNAPRVDKPVAGRPCWLLPDPRKISPGALFGESRCGSRQIERVESGWWQEQDVRRDYTFARTRYGSRCWVYRELNQEISGVREDEAWYVHGLYG